MAFLTYIFRFISMSPIGPKMQVIPAYSKFIFIFQVRIPVGCDRISGNRTFYFRPIYSAFLRFLSGNRIIFVRPILTFHVPPFGDSLNPTSYIVSIIIYNVNSELTFFDKFCLPPFTAIYGHPVQK